MAAFAEILKQARPPGRTLTLEPWVFADVWENRPTEPVCIGLRLMSDADKSKGRAAAEELAYELHPKRGENWLDAFNDALVRQVAALGVCDPNDVSKPSQILPYAEEQVRFAVTSRGARYIFDEYQLYELEVAPLGELATDAELLELSALLQQTETIGSPARRLLKRALADLKRARR